MVTETLTNSRHSIRNETKLRAFTYLSMLDSSRRVSMAEIAAAIGTSHGSLWILLRRWTSWKYVIDYRLGDGKTKYAYALAGKGKHYLIAAGKRCKRTGEYWFPPGLLDQYRAEILQRLAPTAAAQVGDSWVCLSLPKMITVCDKKPKDALLLNAKVEYFAKWAKTYKLTLDNDTFMALYQTIFLKSVNSTKRVEPVRSTQPMTLAARVRGNREAR